MIKGNQHLTQITRLIGRRELMRNAVACIPLALIGGEAAVNIPNSIYDSTDYLSGQRLYQDVVTYSKFGDHRTATTADIETSRWLADELRRVGFEAKLEPFTLQQFYLKTSALIIDGKPVKSFPLWWPQTTGANPVTGPLVAVTGNEPPGSLKGRIALVKIPPVAGASIIPNSSVHKIIGPVVQTGVAAIVAVTLSPTGEIVALNAMAGPDKWPLPILTVGQSDESMLDTVARTGAQASVQIDGTYNEKAEAFETIGRLKRGKNLMIVSTPSSGWFQCAGERGPGIALWLGLARWAAARKSDMSWLFVASSGHELNGVGIRHFIDHIAPQPGEVRGWLHLGAGIATNDYKKTGQGLEKAETASRARRLFSSADFEPVLADAFAGLPDLKPIVADRPGGEMVAMAQRGYRYFGFAGGSVFHHMPGDVPERITSPGLLEPVGHALVKALAAIEAGVVKGENK